MITIFIFSILDNIRDHFRCIIQVLPSTKIAIFVTKPDDSLELKIVNQKRLTILEQNEINPLYTIAAKGDSGSGVIREGKVDNVNGVEDESRSTILATIELGPSFGNLLRGVAPNNCPDQVSEHTEEQKLWIKTIQQTYYDNGISI